MRSFNSTYVLSVQMISNLVTRTGRTEESPNLYDINFDINFKKQKTAFWRSVSFGKGPVTSNLVLTYFSWIFLRKWYFPLF